MAAYGDYRTNTRPVVGAQFTLPAAHHRHRQVHIIACLICNMNPDGGKLYGN